MINKDKVLRINRNTNLLAPGFLSLANRALEECHDMGLNVEIFEGWRSPERQAELYSQGRTKPGKIVTKASPFFSLHNFGLAIDVVFYQNGKWLWDGAYDKVAAIFKKHGFDDPPSFELSHFQISRGFSATEIRMMTMNSSVQGVWLTLDLA